MSETRRPRLWKYDRRSWSGVLPSIGGDEWGRLTIVVPLPFGPVVVFALWNSCDWRGHVRTVWGCDRCGVSEEGL